MEEEESRPFFVQCLQDQYTLPPDEREGEAREKKWLEDWLQYLEADDRELPTKGLEALEKLLGYVLYCHATALPDENSETPLRPLRRCELGRVVCDYLPQDSALGQVTWHIRDIRDIIARYTYTEEEREQSILWHQEGVYCDVIEQRADEWQAIRDQKAFLAYYLRGWRLPAGLLAANILQ